VKFRGAEMRHPDIGRKLLDGIAEVLKGTVVIERSPMMEGKMMSMIISRAPGWEPPKKQVPTPSSKKHHHTTPATTSETATTSTPVLVQESTEATVPPSE
jgi:translation initiation factor IF-3